MIIGGNEVKEITITTKGGSFVATVTDENIVHHDDFVVVLREDD